MDPHNDFDKHDYPPGPCISACREKERLGVRQGWCWTCVQELRRQWREESEAERVAHNHFAVAMENRALLAEAQRDKLRSALAALVGVDGREELEQMEVVMRLMPAPAEDKAHTVDAIHALIATLPPKLSKGDG